MQQRILEENDKKNTVVYHVRKKPRGKTRPIQEHIINLLETKHVRFI